MFASTALRYNFYTCSKTMQMVLALKAPNGKVLVLRAGGKSCKTKPSLYSPSSRLKPLDQSAATGFSSTDFRSCEVNKMLFRSLNQGYSIRSDSPLWPTTKAPISWIQMVKFLPYNLGRQIASFCGFLSVNMVSFTLSMDLLHHARRRSSCDRLWFHCDCVLFWRLYHLYPKGTSAGQPGLLLWVGTMLWQL